MFAPRAIARSLIASVFVAGGLAALRKPKQIAPDADEIAQPIADQVGLDTDTDQLVTATGAVQVVGGALFAAGVVPRVTGLVLGATLVPTTLGAHRFWEETRPAERERQLLAFLKNAAILGGLIYVALDTGGRPSVFWMGRRAAVNAGDVIGSTVASVADTLTPA